MRWTIARLRKEVWKILSNPKTTIDYKNIKNAAALSYYSDEECGCEIYIDHYKTDVRSAAVHEILHSIFDKHFHQFATYNVYEYWITSLEAPLFKKMSKKDKERWRRVIERKLKKSQRLKKLKS